MTADEVLDFDGLQRKYAEERDKRLVAGDRQYREITGSLSRLLEDPATQAPRMRLAMAEEVDVLIVGGGISGLCTAAHLRKSGIGRLRIIEAASDFGGTWYWNRYPGAACDIEAYIYLPLLEETAYIPTQKYADATEIFGYLCRLARHFSLYDRTCFQTRVTDLRWNDEQQLWLVSTNHNDVFKARFVSLATGGLSLPKLPDIKGLDTFKGHSFHASRWDYRYTGSSSDGSMPLLHDKRIAVIGTGATAIQIVPSLAANCKHLYVFQRTASAVHPRANHVTDEHWAKTLQPGWQQKRMRNFQEILLGMSPELNLVSDSWTDIALGLNSRVCAPPKDDNAAATIENGKQLADFRVMEAVRRRIEHSVQDPNTAEALKPYYNVFCKRPCFHDEYLATFNRQNVTLVDTKGRGVDEITPRGLVFDGREYSVDCIVYSTGFEVAALPHRAGNFTVWGRGERSLKEKWSTGFRSLHGIFINGFPNLTLVGAFRDGAASVNGTYIFEGQARHVARVVKRCLDENIKCIEISREAEDRWLHEKLQKQHPATYKFLRDCTPGFLNGEGTVDAESLSLSVYGGSAIEYFEILDAWLTTQFYDDMSISAKELGTSATNREK